MKWLGGMGPVGILSVVSASLGGLREILLGHPNGVFSVPTKESDGESNPFNSPSESSLSSSPSSSDEELYTHAQALQTPMQPARKFPPPPPPRSTKPTFPRVS